MQQPNVPSSRVTSQLATGIYEALVTEELAGTLARTPVHLVQVESLDPADSHLSLTRHLAGLISRSLQAVPGSDSARLSAQIELANRIAGAVAKLSAPNAVLPGDRVADVAQHLLAVAMPPSTPAPATFPARPEVPLSTSALLVNGRGQPRIGYEVERELASADSVDLLCAFITWHGVRVLERALQNLHERGVRLRVITTTYLGATEPRAVERLIAAGADVRISYETRTTRLHAKAWLFHRRSGFSTGYVGSSNLSRAALVDGLEWNVRLSSVEQAHLLQTFSETFDSYWHDPAFEPYDAGRFTAAIAIERGVRTDSPTEITSLDVAGHEVGDGGAVGVGT